MLRALIDHCVHRRVAVVALTLALAAFGFRAYLNTPIEAYPDVTDVQVFVIAQGPGLAPEEMERQVTVPLERALNGTPGMTGLRSETYFGLSMLILTFEDKFDSFKARLLTSERLATADLPDGIVPQLAPDATPLGKIFIYRLTSDRHTLYELRAEQEWNVAKALKRIPGVADVFTFGGYYKELHVQADPARLNAHNLTILDVAEALEQSNLNVGGGFLQQGDQELVIRGIGYLLSADDIRKVVLRSEKGTPVTVGDVARVIQSHTPRRGTVALNENREDVEGIVLLRRGQNPSRVLDALHGKVEELNGGGLPKGMRIEVLYDRSSLIGKTLVTVQDNLLHGFLLVVGLVWLFLRSVRGSLIVAAIIPLSLLAAFTGLHALGLSANLISMGAIDFGILVDGAVVLVENVIHRIQERRPKTNRERLHLVIHAALDVAQPTFYAMMIIIAALIPVFTLQRVEGRIFQPLALTYSFALIAALVFAFTVVPALCAIVLKTRYVQGEEPAFLEKLRETYGMLLKSFLARRPAVVATALLLLALGGLAGSRLGTEFLPELDEGGVFVFVEMPPSISLEQGQALIKEIRQRLLAFPEVQGALSEQGRPESGTDNETVNLGKVTVLLKPRDEWQSGLDKDALIDAMRENLNQIPGVILNFSQPIRDTVEEALAGARGQVVLKLFGTDFQAMRATLLDAKAALRDVPGIVDLDLYRDAIVPQFQIKLDRLALARNGITVKTAQDTLETALAGRLVTEMWEKERPVPIRVTLPFTEKSDIRRIGQLTVVTPAKARIPLDDLADIQVASGPASVFREDNNRFLALKFNVDGRDLGSVVEDAMQAVNGKVRPPEGHYFEWTGEFENQQRAMARLRLVIPIAVAIVMALLYGALSSGRSASVIMLTVPFALTGGVFALLLTGIALSISAAVGFIALLGQVSLMGLLILSAIETRRHAGEALIPAILAGARERLRAILMASLLALFGLLPMALSTGVGSETQKPFAVVIVGGMVTTLLVALFLLPIFYTYLTPPRLLTPEEEDEL